MATSLHSSWEFLCKVLLETNSMSIANSRPLHIEITQSVIKNVIQFLFSLFGNRLACLHFTLVGHRIIYMWTVTV